MKVMARLEIKMFSDDECNKCHMLIIIQTLLACQLLSFLSS